MSNVEIVSLNGKDTEKLSCELRNERSVKHVVAMLFNYFFVTVTILIYLIIYLPPIYSLLCLPRDVRISLVVWGKLALDLGKAIQLFRDKTLICVVTFGKIKVWKGNLLSLFRLHRKRYSQ